MKKRKKYPIVSISICSTVGSISVMYIKAFGIPLKSTLSGSNQVNLLSTYIFTYGDYLHSDPDESFQ